MREMIAEMSGYGCRTAAVTLFLALGATAVAAQERPGPFISEIRAGAFVHDVESLEGDNDIDLNAEVLFAPLRVRHGNGFMDYFLSPRPHMGTTINFDEDELSEAYAGLTWDVPLSQSFFLEFTFGGAVHNGDLDDYGCRANFRESASMGVNLTENWRLIGTLDHMSNANLCGGEEHNSGQTNAGVRLGYKFD